MLTHSILEILKLKDNKGDISLDNLPEIIAAVAITVILLGIAIQILGGLV